MGSLFDRVQDLMDKINTQAKENLQGVRVVKSFNQEGQEIDKFNQTSDNLNNVNLKIGYLFSTVIPSFELIAYVIIAAAIYLRSEEHTSELQSRFDLVCRLLLEKKKHNILHE